MVRECPGTNSTDRRFDVELDLLPAVGTYNGSGTTGTLWIDAMQNCSTFGGSVIEMAATGTGSNPISNSALRTLRRKRRDLLCRAEQPHRRLVRSIGSRGERFDVHSMIGVMNGASSVLKVDGTETDWHAVDGQPHQAAGLRWRYGGGSDQGFIPGPAAISSTVASTSQRQALCLFDHGLMGSRGTC